MIQRSRQLPEKNDMISEKKLARHARAGYSKGMANENTVLASANFGEFHLAVTKLTITKRLGNKATSEERWANNTPRRLRKVWVIRMGITADGLAKGGCDCTHALTTDEAVAQWNDFVLRNNLTVDAMVVTR